MAANDLMMHAPNSYGDGDVCERIADVLEYGEMQY